MCRLHSGIAGHLGIVHTGHQMSSYLGASKQVMKRGDVPEWVKTVY